MTARTLMIQGTASHVGKSLLTAAVCRLFARRGVRVAPFKAQNMSNNAAVCPDGAEIGRAQALQAAAAGIEPAADMNPVLLKPEADARSQVVVHGRPWRTLAARDYYERKRQLWSAVTESLDRLRSQFDVVVIEGAGSPVELNLKRGDIVNMAVARRARSPVLLAGNIDVGGIFAQLLGTLDLLEPDERRLVRGLLVNKFRGDPALFADGVRMIEDRGRVPVLGVVPFLPYLGLPEEDAVTVETGPDRTVPATVEIAVVRFPRIANFDDFGPLEHEPGVRVRYVDSPSHLGRPHAVILPGTKSTVADLHWLRDRGLANAITRLAGSGTSVVGICGGYQMLGRTIRDPGGVEAAAADVPGLGLLAVDTLFHPEKATHLAAATLRGGTGWLAPLAGQEVTGYEIHMGQTASPGPWLTLTRRGGSSCEITDGATSHGGRVWGCYLHGLFANDGFRRAWLLSLAPAFAPAGTSAAAQLQAGLDRLADAFAAAIPFDRIEQIVNEGVNS